MKFAHFSHVWNKPGMTAARRYEQLWRELATCDELGFDFGFTVEHHFNPNESWMPSPSIYCTGAAARTRRMRHGPMGYVVPLYDPVRIAEDAAVLDNVLNGRLELGLVSGIVPDFFGPYRADFKNRRALANETLALVKQAFSTEGPFSFAGPFHQYENVMLSVKPLQKPHPPLWMQSRDADTLELLAQEGVNTGYLFLVPRKEVAPRYRDYLRSWRQAGHPEKPNIGYWVLVYVDETDEKAVARAKPYFTHCFTKVFGTRDDGGIGYLILAENFAKPGEPGGAEIAKNAVNLDYLLEHNLAFVGSPKTVTEKIKAAATEGLFNTVLGEFNIGDIGEDDLLRSIRLFGTEVLPALRSFEPY
ncbi:MAG: LLM class flavin-dependent oxidoreductase [Deltaproteobacteria bacterium]|nr:MAG: LLM class flavin-dependent oxidoreductase [Deltaproteobacteria bacterium]